MPDFVKMGLILMVVGVVATTFLAMTDGATREPIALAKRQETLLALAEVVPGFDNDPAADSIQMTDPLLNRKGKPVTFYRARKMGGDNVGVAFTVTAPDGYSGNIDIMLGVKTDGVLSGIKVLSHAETPGLGDKITLTNWPDAFKGKSLGTAKWAVKKDGGEFDQFAGATITPRAVVGAVKRGLEYFEQHRDQLFTTAATTAGAKP
ncbi:MAG: RnfABCDGE type electron transport complex subunit G [Magnetococcales bacterium]|nr:RnfABCDGE type electron transport complex subunit G [Magnetococcales bacterium]